MKKIIFTLAVSIQLGSWAHAYEQGEAWGCHNLPGDVQLKEDGSLYGKMKDKYQLLDPSSSVNGIKSYEAKQGSNLWSWAQYNYKVESQNGKPTKLSVKYMNGFAPLDGLGATQWGQLDYELGTSKDGKCFVKTIKDPDMKKIVYDSMLCQKLVDKFDKMATPALVQQCTAIWSEMNEAVKDYLNQHPKWSIEPEAKTPFEKSMSFVMNCKKALGHEVAELSKKTPGKKEEARNR